MSDVAKEWERTSIKGVAVAVVGGGTPSREVPQYWGGGIPWATPGELTGLQGKYLSDTADTITDAGLASSGARLLPQNALLVTTRATLGLVALTRGSMTTNQGFKSIVFTSRAYPDFYYHLLATLKHEMVRLASGTTFLELSGSQFGRIEVPLPPLWEQRRIAEMLDALDSQIWRTEELIRKRLLQKVGLVDHFVNEASRVELEVRSLGEVVNRNGGFIQTGPFGSQLHSSDYVDDGIPVVMPQDISEGRVNLDSIARVSESMAGSLARHRMLPGDVVFARRGDLGRCAEITTTEQGWLCGTGCLLVRTPAAVLTAGWLALVYRHELGQRHVRANAVGSTMANLNSKILASMRLPVPPIARQREAVSVITAHDYETSLERRRLAKLYTLKSGLATDLLTGRVRVPVEATS